MTDELPNEKKVEENSLTPVQPAAQIISFIQLECRVVLHKGMFCLIHAFDSNRVQLKTYSVELSPEEYSNWIDDEAMEALILSKVGFVKSK